MGRGPLVALVVAACGARTELTALRPTDASSPVHDSVVKALCSGGVTLLAPTTLASQQLALDDTTVFFEQLDGVYSVPKGGGTATLVVSFKSVSPFVLRATDIVWKMDDPSSTHLLSTPKGGGAATPVLTEPLSFTGFAAAPGGLFIWGSDVTNNQLLLFTPPSTVTLVAKVPLDTFQVIEDGGTLFTASLGGVFSLNSSGVHFIATGPLGNGTLTFANLMSLDATNVYFMSSTDYHMADVMSAPKVGGAATVLSEDLKPQYSDLVLDGEHLYFTESYAGNVVRIALDGSNRTVVASNPKGVLKVAVDTTSLYWTAQDGIYCQAK